jgi:hypothetical protein
LPVSCPAKQRIISEMISRKSGIIFLSHCRMVVTAY